ncbi:archaeosortase/exosortase family protein [Sandaracinobacteroides sayramensis]|uniref:archaeosortase/exosortase family protein n=1 Tax=Sandaracinobacteroides sayramensis TaxID=2913411 RepID=UPI002103C26C|nr:archaeosortase/exosortase family protein [Sandaracinobacteroides sayramensis]
MTAATIPARTGVLDHARQHPLLTLALIVTILPTLYATATQSWTQESGVHGPLVLATAVWLVWRNWDSIVAEARPGHLGIALPVVLVGSAL